jgi:hypothetical protein
VIRRALLVALAAAAFGCSGARSYVVARSATVPISISDGLRGPDGALLADGQKTVVGEFEYQYRAWGMLFRIISFTGDKDISEEINRQVAAAGGDAVNNLEVSSGNCLWNMFTLVGLLPDCANVAIHGDIIKVTGTKPMAASP